MTETSEKLKLAKEFLTECPTESIAYAARIYHLPETTLYNSITRAKEPPKKHGGQNKILQPEDAKPIHTFIRSLLYFGIQPTHQVVFNAISHLQRAQGRRIPSKQWFRRWYKQN